MKTAEEWIESKTHLVKKNVVTDRFTARDIRAIQSDAIGSMKVNPQQCNKELKALRERVMELEDAIGNIAGAALEYYNSL